jgi:hypothetical protein
MITLPTIDAGLKSPPRNEFQNLREHHFAFIHETCLNAENNRTGNSNFKSLQVKFYPNHGLVAQIFKNYGTNVENFRIGGSQVR